MRSRLLRAACACLFSALAMNANVAAATFSVDSMSITGGGFKLWDSDGLSVGDGAVFPFTVIGSDTNLVGGYIGSGGAGLDSMSPDPDTIVGVLWGVAPVNIYTAAFNIGDVHSPAASIAGGPVPAGVLDDVASTITMNLGALIANWADIDFSIGTGKNDGLTSALAAGSWDPISGAYSLSWFTSVDSTVGGPCWSDGCTAEFSFQGFAVAAPVPVPAAVWLFGSGLLGLIGIARHSNRA